MDLMAEDKKLIQDLIPSELKFIGMRCEPILAAEGKEVKKGHFTTIKIEGIEIEPSTIAVLVNFVKNTRIEILDIFVSEKANVADTAVIYANESCKIKKGEVLGFLKISRTIPVEENAVMHILKKINKMLTDVEEKMEEKFVKSDWPIW
uniref:DUF22 domain-containing protein n=1 Tax=Archaeoglobus fulgidus TaxID=2234 RepID=A0A7C2SL91_ARCFL